MDINYFLLLKGKYRDILDHIDSILSDLDDTCDLIDECQDKSLNMMFQPETNKEFFIERRIHFESLKHICHQSIQNVCLHEYVTDLIDMTPDESKSISYCRLCDKSLHCFENR
jgi:hypothetical protein